VAGRQLVAIARALVGDARLIVMDEPTAALTRREVLALLGAIEGLRARGIAALFVSHKLDEVLAVSRRTLVLRNGRVAADAPTAELDRARLAFHMTGREVPEPGEPDEAPPDPAAPPLLRVEGLSVRGALRDVSFELRAGEILGITGLLGSGRTELAMALFGALPAEAGRISVGGRPVRIRSIADALRAGIGLVPEDRMRDGLFSGQPVGRNILAGSLDRLARRAGLIDRRAAGGIVREWMDRLAIRAPSAAAPIESLSGGNQQRVLLARWLAREPRVLVLCGPTAGVDVGSKEELHRILRGLARAGMGLILISDDLPELLSTCRRILILRGGRAAEVLDREGLAEDVLAAKLLQG
jgi:simple sugar transport system ATP-binding protein